jgi:hypothetical protein
MPEKSPMHEEGSAVSPKVDRGAVPASPTSANCDAEADGTEKKPEDEKRIERFRER